MYNMSSSVCLYKLSQDWIYEQYDINSNICLYKQSQDWT